MGHERIGFLPLSSQWRQLVAEIGDIGAAADAVPKLAYRTLLHVRRRFDGMEQDRGLREDLANARASRTTHPKSIADLQRFFRRVADDAPIKIATPFLWKTKRDVVETLVRSDGKDLIASSVSCTRTFQKESNATHCGRCFQCLD